MYSGAQVFGVSGADMAYDNAIDPQTPRTPAMATTEQTVRPPGNPLRAMTDPSHSAIFWITLAAILGLVMVTGQFRVQAALGGAARAGRR